MTHYLFALLAVCLVNVVLVASFQILGLTKHKQMTIELQTINLLRDCENRWIVCSTNSFLESPLQLEPHLYRLLDQEPLVRREGLGAGHHPGRQEPGHVLHVTCHVVLRVTCHELQVCHDCLLVLAALLHALHEHRPGGVVGVHHSRQQVHCNNMIIMLSHVMLS